MRNLHKAFMLMAAVGLGYPLLSRAERPVRAPIAGAQGKQVYDHWCAPCHAPSYRASGTSALAVKYGKDQPAALEQRRDLTPEVIAYFVRHGVSIMPTFRKTEITDAELAALSNYLTKNNAPPKKR